MEDHDNLVTVTIPKTLYTQIENRIKGTKFSSVSNYVTYMLSETMTENSRGDKGEHFSEKDEEAVKERLRALGYID